jgi:hypothetical protein
MKSIKYLSWENIFEEKINKLRNNEFKALIILRGGDGILSVFWITISYILLYSFLISYIDMGNKIGDSNVFTIIALFGYLTYPLGVLVNLFLFSIFKVKIKT